MLDFVKNIVFLSLKIVFFILAKVYTLMKCRSIRYAAFHLGIHGLPKYAFRSHWYIKGY